MNRRSRTVGPADAARPTAAPAAARNENDQKQLQAAVPRPGDTAQIVATCARVDVAATPFERRARIYERAPRVKTHVQ